MKRTLLFASILLFAGMVTSCLREDDLEMFRHPIHVTGEIHPQYGVPIGQGEMNVNDLLSHLSSSYTGMLDSTSDLIVIKYDTAASDTIWPLSNVGVKKYTPKVRNVGAKAAMWTKDTTVRDTIEIDFFDDVEFLDSMDIAHIWLHLAVNAIGDCPDAIKEYISASFNNLSISYIDHAGVTKNFPSFLSDTMFIDDIESGVYKNFDSVDVATIVNDRPKKIITSYNFTFGVSSAILANMSSMPWGQILDSLHMTWLSYSAKLGVTMPLSVSISQLNYSFPVDLGDGLASVNIDSIVASINSHINVDIKQSIIKIVLDNGIPLNLTLSADLLKANGNVLVNLFTDEVVPAAPIAQVPGDPTSYYATGKTAHTIQSTLNEDQLDLLKKAKTMRLKVKMDSNNKHVQLKRSDFLTLKLYLIVSPSASFDIPVTNGGII